MKVNTYNQNGEQVGKADLPAKVFGVAMNKDLIHQAVTAQMANSRQVIAHTKDRSEVRGGGIKPWRQKGTGRARHGSIRSPLWRGGGITFGPTNQRNFSKKINKKMKTKALFMALSSKNKDNELVVLDKLELNQAKTKQMASVINNLKTALSKDLDKGLLIVLPTGTGNEAIIKATKNIPKITTIGVNSLNIIDILSHKYLMILKGTEKLIEKKYQL